MNKIKEKMKNLKNWFSKVISDIRWFFTELLKIYSPGKSFFSKKRVESGVAFLIAQLGMIFFLIKKIDTMDVYELSIWAGMEFLIAGYTVSMIQKENKDNTQSIAEDNEDNNK